MKKIYCFIWAILYLLMGNIAMLYAANGDTAWVKAHDTTWLSNYGNYDTVVHFPDHTKSYKRIIMEFTLGKYVCPGSPQYCSDWDYTVQNILITPAGDTVELARLITPYGRSNRMPANYKHRYYFDVTDFYPLFIDSGILRVNYQGYSGGFTAGIRLAFVEGPRDYDVLEIQKLWLGGFAYGDASNPIDSMVKPQTVVKPNGTNRSELKVWIAGHGADNAYCSEFCSRDYYVKVDGTQVDRYTIWKDDCGWNQLYPQNGTWIYDRANWCPGELVNVVTHTLPLLGSQHSVDIDFQSHNSNGGASYLLQGVVFHYGPYLQQKDLAIESIIAPSDYEGYFRQNPTCLEPIIIVKNRGTDTVMQFEVACSIDGSMQQTFVVNDVIAPGVSKTFALGSMTGLKQVSGNGHAFSASITRVNAKSGDDYTLNNSLTSQFDGPKILNPTIIINLRSNNTLDNYWRLLDANNQVVAERRATSKSTTFRDTIHNLSNGCYKLEVRDNECDGLSWWANSSQGTGNIQLASPPTSGFRPLTGLYSGDFGCGFDDYFIVTGNVGINEIGTENPKVGIHPNPFKNELFLEASNAFDTYKVQVLDGVGRLVYSKNFKASLRISTDDWLGGMYIVQCINLTDATNIVSSKMIRE